MFTIIIPWNNREEIEKTLSENIKHFKNEVDEVFIVNCGGNLHLLKTYLKQIKISLIKIVNIPSEFFNKSLALNIGIHFAKSDFVFFLDTDVILKENILKKTYNSLFNNSCFVTVQKVKESIDLEGIVGDLTSVSNIIQLQFKDGKTVQVETNQVYLETNERGAPGLIGFKKDDFLKINGMNSDLTGWGWEDVDLITRFMIILDLERKKIGEVIHLSHNNEARSNEDVENSESLNFQKCMVNYSLGDFQGTYLEDTSMWLDKIKMF